jgi:signal transduction histidine kinase/GAF domain-containing protein
MAHPTAITATELERTARLNQSLRLLNELSTSALVVPAEDFLNQAARSVCEFFSVPACVIWSVNEGRRLRIIATHEKAADDLKARWRCLLTASMYAENELIGMVDLFSDEPCRFEQWEQEWFSTFVNQIALNIRKAELREKSERLLSNTSKLELLNRILREISEVHYVDHLLHLTLQRALELVDADRGWISLFDPKADELKVVTHSGESWDMRSLKLGQGITGMALREERAIRVNDVQSMPLRSVYEPFWPDTRSELAIPIVISNALIRVGHDVKESRKALGVLNIESTHTEAFSEADEVLLSWLAGHAAIIMDKLETDHKFANLREIEREIVGKQDWDETIQIVLRAISNTLGYEYVNISLVDTDLKRIKTKYVVGISRKEVELFKRMADYSLDGNDIHAQIVRSKEVEVPEAEDPRFDQKVFKRFGHERLIRVFIPMIVASENRVIGTVEAGYKRSYRKHIYERDVQILRGFVNYAVRALEQSKKGLLPKITHELTAPVVGIRSTASFLQRRIEMLDPSLVQVKLNDILTDSEILLLRVGELEHILGKTTPLSRPELTLVYRDIIIKTVNQLKPLVAERGLDASKIEYRTWDIHRIKLYVDKAKLNSVVYNLLINSIKYSEDEPSEFKIMISVDETHNDYIIKFKDWGIGIKNEYAEKVFADGFRTPEAIDRFVTGTGLGLTIARKTMREMGGDLRLTHNSKPTQFDVVLPKSLKEVPDDPLRR